MVQTVGDILYFILFPNVLYYFYCRCCLAKYLWWGSLLYTILSAALSFAEASGSLQGGLLLLIKILLLALCGMAAAGQKPVRAVIMGSLVISVYYLTTGLLQSIEYLAVANLDVGTGALLPYLGALKALAGMALFSATFFLLPGVFFESIKEISSSAMLLQVIPLFFIALVEQTVSVFIYGNTLIWDTEAGLVYPRVDNKELILLHLSAYAGMWVVMAAFRSTVKASRSGQLMELLKQQTKQQERYVAEARARDERTKAFRHDIRNHLLVLRELMRNGDLGQAVSYLESLEEISDAAAFPARSGNAAVDALLGCKLTDAVGHKIRVECDLMIPAPCIVKDMDWCILLANGLDNAVTASCRLREEDRYIRIAGKKKGNLYLLQIENSCRKELREFEYGTGLHNVAAVAARYDGTARAVAAEGIFRLDVLLVISQQ